MVHGTRLLSCHMKIRLPGALKAGQSQLLVAMLQLLSATICRQPVFFVASVIELDLALMLFVIKKQTKYNWTLIFSKRWNSNSIVFENRSTVFVCLFFSHLPFSTALDEAKYSTTSLEILLCFFHIDFRI